MEVTDIIAEVTDRIICRVEHAQEQKVLEELKHHWPELDWDAIDKEGSFVVKMRDVCLGACDVGRERERQKDTWDVVERLREEKTALEERIARTNLFLKQAGEVIDSGIIILGEV